jgi:hypothetical protein
MGVVVWFVNYWLRDPSAQLTRLAIAVPTGVLVYSLMVRFLWIQGWQDIQGLIGRPRPS